MRSSIKTNSKKILAILLSAALSFSMNMTVFADVIHDNGDTNAVPVVENETVPVEEIAEDSIPTDTVTADDSTVNDVSADDVSTDDVSTDDVYADDVSADDVSVDTVSEDSVSEDSVSEDSVSEDSISEDSVSADIAEDDTIVQLTDEKFIFLLSKDFKQKPAFANLAENNGRIAQSELDKIRTLIIEGDYSDTTRNNWWYVNINLSDLKYFRNLKHLEINGQARDCEINLDDEIELPKTLTTLILNRCHVEKNIDVSKCENLSKLVYHYCTTSDKARSKGVVGLTGLGTLDKEQVEIESDKYNGTKSTLKNLKEISFFKSDIQSFNLATFEDGTPRKGLNVYIRDCENLDALSFGGYTLVGSPTISECPKIEQLKIQGYADSSITSTVESYDHSEYSAKEGKEIDVYKSYSANSILDLSGSMTAASGKNKLIIDYSFDRTDTSLLIDGRACGAKCEWTVEKEGEVQGKIKLLHGGNAFWSEKEEAFDEVFLETSGDSIQFVVFEQEREKFETQQLWKMGKSTNRRNYRANPIVFWVGQTLEDNAIYCYTKDGKKVTNVSYDNINYSVKTLAKGNGQEGDVIEVDNSQHKFKVTALHTGIAQLTVSVPVGSGSASEVQEICVYDPVASISMNQNFPKILGTGIYRASTMMRLTDTTITDVIRNYEEEAGNSISKPYKNTTVKSMIFGYVGIELYRKDGEQETQITNWTEAGLEVLADSGQSTDAVKTFDGKSESVVIIPIQLKVSDKFPAGEYRILVWSKDNYKLETHGLRGSDYNKKGYPLVSADFNFTVDHSNQSNQSNQSSDTLGYGYETNRGTTQQIPSQVTITAPAYYENYTAEAKIELPTKAADYLDLQKDSSSNSFQLSFKSGKTSKEIATFLKGLGNNNIAKVGITVKDTSHSGEGVQDTVVYMDTITVKLTGNFTIDYDANGGVNHSENPSNYQLPAAASVTLLPPTNRGKTFTGWYLGEKKIEQIPDDNALGDITLKAEWSGSGLLPFLTRSASGTEYTLNLASKQKYSITELAKVKADGKLYKITETKADKAVAAMSVKGLVQAKKAGTAHIQLDKSGVTYNITVNVYNPQFVYENPKVKSFAVNVGDTITPTYDDCLLETRFEIPLKQQRYATVDPESGVVTPIAKGNVTVSAIVGEGKLARKVSTKVYVYNPELIGASTVKVRKSITLKVKNGAKQTTWSVENGTGAAEITSKGKLKGTAAGTVTVKAVNNGKTMTKEVTITE